MNFVEFIKNWVFSVRKLKRVGNPDDPRLQFITNDEQIRIYEVNECKTWLISTDKELDNFYLQRQVIGNANNPIYNRNGRQYFWAKSQAECNFKKIATGVSKAIVDTISNIVGEPILTSDYPGFDELVDSIDFKYRLVNECRTYTCAVGDGCWKWCFNKDISSHPLLQFVESLDYKPIYKSGMLVAIAFYSYYKDKNDKDYMLVETRTLTDDGCAVDFKLFNRDKNEISETALDTISETANLKPQFIPIRSLFAVPTRYYYNSLYKDRGLSIYANKIPLFDMLDEIWTQASQTDRVSTPVEYYSTDILKRDKNGSPVLPSAYNRQYIAKNSTPDADGLNASGQGIMTTQPDLNFDKYGILAKATMDFIFIGLISPASMGFDVSKKDNAEAEREKEKQTIFTRNNIIAREIKQCKEVLEQGILLDTYFNTGKFVKYDVNVKYNEFANPSTESQLKILGPAWVNGELSTERYVELLWGDSLNDDEKRKEIEYLNSVKAMEYGSTDTEVI